MWSIRTTAQEIWAQICNHEGLGMIRGKSPVRGLLDHCTEIRNKKGKRKDFCITNLATQHPDPLSEKVKISLATMESLEPTQRGLLEQGIVQCACQQGSSLVCHENKWQNSPANSILCTNTSYLIYYVAITPVLMFVWIGFGIKWHYAPKNPALVA